MAKLGADGVANLLNLLHGTDWFRVERRFGPGYGIHPRSAEAIQQAFERPKRE